MPPRPPVKRPTARADAHASRRPALAAADRNARVGEANVNAKVTEATVRAWRRAAAAVVTERRAATGGRNVRTGAPLVSLLRGTGLFARLAREHEPPVSVAAVCMAVYGQTWAHVPGALPRYKPRRRRA